MVLLPIDFEAAIEKIKQAGANVSRKTHAIYARETADFTNEHYPLDIIVSDNLPEELDAMIAPKGKQHYAS